VGIFPALGSGLTDLRRTGQHERLLDYDLRAYCEAYDRVYYFSYFQESLTDFTRDPVLLDKVCVVPRRGPWPKRIYALLMPFLNSSAMRQCEAIRVEQFSGVIPALIARARFGTPIVVTYGYHYGEVARIAGSRLKPRLYAWLEALAFPRAAGVIVTSPEMEARLDAHSRRPRLAFVPNGVDTSQFAPAPPRETPRQDGRTVFYVGRLEAEKNLARLLEALAGLPTPVPRLVIAGEGSLRPRLESLAREIGVPARFLGVVPHSALPALFQTADCFVLPSLTEGHPKALIEAMACGLPCAASRRGGIPGLIEDGVTGLLFDPEDVTDMRDVLGRLVDDPTLAARLGAAARAAVVSSYDVRRLLRREVDFVRSVSGAGAMTQLFERYAEDVSMDEALPVFAMERLRALAARAPRSVLDLGAGDGRYLALFSRLLAAETRLVGCEISLTRAQRIRDKGFRVVVAQSEALPFKSDVFDLVTLMEVIEHTQSPGTSLDEARRVLGRGGRLALTTPNYPMKRLFDVRAAVRQRSWQRLRDDPTHISPLSAGRLERLLRPRFPTVFLEGTAIPGEGRLPWLGKLRRSWLGRRLSNKIFALCTRPQ
jgi:glycosyltransferase involved in cell wall biosynthesis/SAM-dependent methyltransferase